MPSLLSLYTPTHTSSLPSPGRTPTPGPPDSLHGLFSLRVFRTAPYFFGHDLALDISTFHTGPKTLIQYVDDLLLCSSTLPLHQQATSLLLNYLSSLGYCVSPSTAQLCSPTVVYRVVNSARSLRPSPLTGSKPSRIYRFSHFGA